MTYFLVETESYGDPIQRMLYSSYPKAIKAIQDWDKKVIGYEDMYEGIRTSTSYDGDDIYDVGTDELIAHIEEIEVDGELEE